MWYILSLAFLAGSPNWQIYFNIWEINIGAQLTNLIDPKYLRKGTYHRGMRVLAVMVVR